MLDTASWVRWSAPRDGGEAHWDLPSTTETLASDPRWLDEHGIPLILTVRNLQLVVPSQAEQRGGFSPGISAL